MLYFSIKQLWLHALQTCRFRASSIQLLHICQKKSKNISFPWYSKFLFLHRHSRVAQDLDQAQTSATNSHICLFWSMKINAPKLYLTATFLQLGAKYAILLDQGNFSAFKISIVFYCFVIKSIKHKISKVLIYSDVWGRVTLQIEQSSCTI